MGFMKRRDIVTLNVQQGMLLMNDLVIAHNSGYPIEAVLQQYGLNFPELFTDGSVSLYHDAIREIGVSQITLLNTNSSFAFIRPTGAVMITFNNSNAIKRYEGGGIIAVVTRRGTQRQNRRIYLSPDTLQPYFMNGGDCR